MSRAHAAVVVCCSLLVGGAFAQQAVAQSAKGAGFVPGRLWDGKTPDFRGIWQARGTAYVNLEGHAGGSDFLVLDQW